MIQALIFDFDGLILETESPVYQSWEEMYAAHQQHLPLELWATVIGTYEEPFDAFEHLQTLVNYPLNKEELLTLRRKRELELVEAQPILPGVAEYLSSAAQLGLKIGLASSSSCRWVTGHLKRLELLDYFDCVRGKDDVAITKPDPALYLTALDCLRVSASQTIALEDSPNGILAAKRAGLFCVAIPNEMTRRLDLSRADLRLESLHEMPLANLIELAHNCQPA